MSLHTSSKAGPGRVRILLTLMLAVLGMSACSAGDLFTPNHTGAANLALRPVFSSVASSSMSSLDINFIRLTIKQLPNGPTTVQDTTVDPNSDSWSLPITAPFNAELEVTIELINKTGGTEVTVFSGQVDVKVPANSQQQPPPTPVPVFPGSPANLGIQNVTIAPREQSVLEGGTVQLSATVAPAIANPTITWESANPSIASVDPNTGLVTAKLPGQATIRAHAGPKSDETTVTVGPRATKIELTPTSATIPSLGASASFTAKVEDARGAVVPGINATLAIGDATIASQTSPGVFKALKNGTTTVTATATQAGQLIIGTATLKVEQKAVTVTIDPTSASFSALGRTATFKASAKDANNNDVTGLTFTWSSSDNTVATVDANGVVTARGNGKATIKADLAGVSATADVTVQQTPASLTVTPTEATLKSLGEKTTLVAQVKDAAGNVMGNVPVVWQSSLPTIATIDANGVVTAQGDGTVAILASAGSQHAAATIYVDRVVANVRMNSASENMTAGATKQFGATATDALGSAMNVPLVWSSTKASVAAVNSSGLVSALSAGSAEIRATAPNGLFGGTAVTVTGVAGAGSGDLVINNDIDIFYSYDPSLQWMKNLISFTRAGSRAAGSNVWEECGRAPIFGSDWCNRAPPLESVFNGLGYTWQRHYTTAGTMTSIPADVKLIIFFMPTALFTDAEISVLRTFMAEGGRIFYIGEHYGFTATHPPELQLIRAYGSNMNIAPDCLYGTGTIVSPTEQLTAGVTGFPVNCASYLTNLGSTDTPLVTLGGQVTMALVKPAPVLAGGTRPSLFDLNVDVKNLMDRNATDPEIQRATERARQRIRQGETATAMPQPAKRPNLN